MLGKLFGKRNQRHYINAKLNARIMPLTRADIEDALGQALENAKLGSVDGGGTAISADGSMIESCDIEIVVNDLSESTISFLVEKLGRLVPRGSVLQLPDGMEVPIGNLEGLEMLFEDADSANDFVGRLTETDPPHYYGDYGSAGCALNLYGESFAEWKRPAEHLSSTRRCSSRRSRRGGRAGPAGAFARAMRFPSASESRDAGIGVLPLHPRRPEFRRRLRGR